MRRYVKNEILDLLNTLLKASKSIKQYISSGKRDDASFSTLLQDCQDAAISIGNSIEGSEGEGTDAVKHLEDYCELLYKFSTGEEKATYKLDTCINGCINEIKQLPERIEAVFLPYKASMWDSLESVWMAADEDPDCDAYVIPIPYYDKNPDGSFKAEHYEGSLYPDNIPIVDYRSYNIAERHPDLIFIHNPYDEYNHVTSVHPDYYSHVLKQYTNCLVYIPYYATSGSMSEEWSLLPSYVYADYIVVQTKDMIKFFDPVIPREKFLPLGSPKFDRVIRMCNNPPEPPEEWKEKLEGKRVYFYNTSLSGMLQDTESFLKKMRYVFDTFKEIGDACLLWRPHPLFESSLESLRPEYRAEYEKLKQQFLQDDFGIFDTTPDIESTIALCDAYLGDSGTSVISLFEAAGKAVYLLDNRVTEKPGKDAWKGIYCIYPSKDPRVNKAFVMPEDKLFWSPNNDLKYEFFCNLPKDTYHNGYQLAFSFGGNIYVFPRNAQNILIISEETRKIRTIFLKEYDIISDAFAKVMVFGEEYVFLVPNKYPELVRFSFATEKLDYVKDIKDLIWSEKNGERILCACATSGKHRKLLLCIDECRKLLNIDVDNLDINIIETGFNQISTVMISENWKKDKFYWFLPYEGTTVIRWNYDENTYNTYDLDIEGLYSYDTSTHTRRNKNYFSSIAPLEDTIIFAPRWATKFVQLDLNNMKVSEWTPPFKVILENNAPYFTIWNRGWFVWDMNSQVSGYSNSPERITYDIDFDNNVATPIYVEINKKDIEDQYCKGFDSESKYLPVCCKESPWNDMRAIAMGKTTGTEFTYESQKIAFSLINSNVNGTCGKDIYNVLRC